MSQLVLDALRQREQSEHQRKLAEAYASIREEGRTTAEEWTADVAANWPRD